MISASRSPLSAPGSAGVLPSALSASPGLESRWLRFLLPASIALLVLCSLWTWNFTIDDAFIGYRYAQHLLEGHGLVFNDGERVEGYTNFLWVVLEAASGKIYSDLLLDSKLLGIFLNVLALIGSAKIGSLVGSRNATFLGFSLLLTATTPSFVISGVNGLETGLVDALLCWGAWAFLYALRAEGRRNVVIALGGSSGLFGLLSLTRPDATLAYGFLWLYTAVKSPRRGRDLAAFSVPFLCVYVPYFLWRWHYYGLLLPNTFYVKRGGSLLALEKGGGEILQFFRSETGGIFIAALVAAWVLLFPVVETTVLAVVASSRFVFELWSGGAVMGLYRFLVPAVPLVWILVEHVLVSMVKPIRLGRRGSVLLWGLVSFVLLHQLLGLGEHRYGDFAAYMNGLQSGHMALGKWLRINAPAGSSVALADIGAIPFYSGLKVIDTTGLTDTHISHLPGTVYTKTDPGYVLSKSPDFIVLLAYSCEPSLADLWLPMEKGIWTDPRFASDYHPIGCWDFSEDYHLVLYQIKGGPVHHLHSK